MLVIVESILSPPLVGNFPLDMQPEENIEIVLQRFLVNFYNDVNRLNIVVYDKDHRQLELSESLLSQGVEDGAKLTIGYKRTRKVQSLHLVILSVSCLIIAGILLVASSVIYGISKREVPFDFGIVIDAGSTHTEVFLYRWHGSKDHGTGYVTQEDYCKIDEGIATASDPGIVIPCVMQVVKSIPKPAVSQSPLYLGATGGMRILNISQPKEANLILLTLKYGLESTQMRVSSVDIIQGIEEGISSWITSNFLTAALLPNHNHSWNSTYGALDLGGASTQFAYAIDPVEADQTSGVLNLTLYGEKYFVKSKSFLCFGLTEAIRRHETIFIEDMTNVSTTIHDPCLPEEYILTVTLETMFQNPCVQNKKLDNLKRNESGSTELTFIGESNYTACKAHIIQLVNTSACLEAGYQECIDHNDIAEAGRRFLAFSSFYYVTHFLESSNATLEEFISATTNWCKLTWSEMQLRVNKSDINHLPHYCFGGIYIVELLSAYGFNDELWNNIIFQQQINKTDVGWSLGYMINATNAIQEGVPPPPIISSFVYIMLLVLSFVIIIISVCLLRNKIKSYFIKTEYKRLDESLNL